VAGKLIEIRMSKCVIYLYEQELAHLLSFNPELWAAAIKRGKAIKRARTSQSRGLTHVAEVLPGVLEEIKKLKGEIKCETKR